MNRRDRDEVPTVVKLGLGVGIGFALYKLLGWAGSFGLGGRAQGTGTGTGPDTGLGPTPTLTPIPSPSTAPSPPRPRDMQAVHILVRPSPTDPTKAVIEMEGRIVAIGELVARLDAGGRHDVLVTVRGDTVEGAWNEIHAALQFLGIQVLRHLTSGAQGSAAR